MVCKGEPDHGKVLDSLLLTGFFSASDFKSKGGDSMRQT